MENGVSMGEPKRLEKEGESAAQALMRLQKEGYLFHGSTDRGIEKLKPMFSEDLGSKVNTDTAVFATDYPQWSAVFAAYGGDKTWKTESRKNKEGVWGIVASIPSEDREKAETGKGFVYVLPRDGFKRAGGSQYKSHKEVSPIGVVEVGLQDFLAMGGSVEWI